MTVIHWKRSPKPLPRRFLRVKRAARRPLRGIGSSLKKISTPVQIAKSYRKRYGVDWPCAIREHPLLGVSLEQAAEGEEIVLAVICPRCIVIPSTGS
jgi:hypothetical protein